MVINCSDSITVMLTHGPDIICVETNLPNGTWPYKGNACIDIKVAYNTGVEYVKKHFNISDPKVINTR